MEADDVDMVIAGHPAALHDDHAAVVRALGIQAFASRADLEAWLRVQPVIRLSKALELLSGSGRTGNIKWVAAQMVETMSVQHDLEVIIHQT